MKPLILAGGSGSRLWPMSRRNYPKQFLMLDGNRSLLEQTVLRLVADINPEDVVVVTNKEYKSHVRSDLSSVAPSHSCHIVVEPVSRNTAPAIALGVKYCIERLKCGGSEVLFVLPSDHVLGPDDMFRKYLRTAEEIAQKGFIVTFGVHPVKPETGYGYIKTGTVERGLDGTEFYRVERFTEKPDAHTARGYINDGGYYWNSGMFAFRIDTILEEFRKYTPAIHEMLGEGFEGMYNNFSLMPEISVDYAIMEKSERVVVLPLDLYWRDIGSWDSFFEMKNKDDSGNVISGDVFSIETRDSLIIGNKRLVATVGIHNCLIIETDDAILIAGKDHSQKVREMIKQLEQAGRREVSEHVTTYRPWGKYTVLEEGDRYKIKRIVINPGASLSLQKHMRRSEHWVVVKGQANIIIGEKKMVICENESAYVPKSAPHRLENQSNDPLEIIEVQNGEYTGEDDIVRIEDVYGRTEQ